MSLARIVRPHGRRGEVAADILTDFPQRLPQLSAVHLWDGQEARREVKVLSCRLGSGRRRQAVFHFTGSNSIAEAKSLVGMDVQIPISQRVVLPPGQYYVTDLIGCVVCERHEILGQVASVQFSGDTIPGTPLLCVNLPGQQELLIPLAREVCVSIDIAGRHIAVQLPEGLRELNRE